MSSGVSVLPGTRSDIVPIITASARYVDHDLLPAVVMKDGKSAPELPKLQEAPTHFHEFFDAILEGRKARSDFSWSTYLAEAVMMGTLSERAPGRTLTPADMRGFVAQCRKGWEF